MAWVRAHYERVTLLLTTLCLLWTAVLILQNVLRFGENFSTLSKAPSPKPARQSSNVTDLEDAIKKLRHPSQWTFSGRSGLFVPERHFIGAQGFPTTLQTTAVHPPVTNEWLEEFGLPLADADVLSQDPDGDGFKNLEEWQGRTNPTDKSSHPSFVVKLKVKSVTQEAFRLVFASRMAETFAINTNDLKGPTQFLKLGDPIRGTKFKLTAFQEKHEVNKYGTKVDVSELMLENRETSELVRLVKEKIITSPESVVNFVYSWGNPREFAVRKDEQFSLKPEEQIKYKLIDVQPAKAVIIDIEKPNDLIEVALLNP